MALYSRARYSRAVSPLKCPSCSSDIPDESRFCLKCGREIVAAQVTAQPQPQEDDGSEMFAMMCMAFSFMLFFFSLAPFFMGIWIAGVAMLAIGVVLMLAGYRMIRVSKRDRMAMAERKATRIKLKCRYCGSLNDEDSERCGSCGASL
jgi:uncharacterized membrane protein YvbJ